MDCDRCGFQIPADESRCPICGHEQAKVTVIQVAPDEVIRVRAVETGPGGGGLEAVCRVLGYDPLTLAFVLASEANLDVVELDQHPPDPTLVPLVPAALARTRQVIAWGRNPDDGRLVVAVADPLLPGLRAELELAAGEPVQLIAASHVAVRDAISRFHGEG